MYEAVHARPDGRSSVARFARTAASEGYEGLVVRTRAATVPDGLDPAFDAVRGATVDADPEPASGRIGSLRPETTLLCYRGGTPERNRFAVEDARVDVLATPTPARGSFPFDHVLARAAAHNAVRVEFDLGPVVRATGERRARAVGALRRLRDLVETYDAPHVVSVGANSHLGLRGPRALVAVGETVGLDPGFVREGLCEWGRLAARNRDRAGEDYVMPGVRRGRYDPADWDGEGGEE